jgi:hypothetical protein
MKKNILVIAAALVLSLTACQKEDIITPGNNVTPGNGGNNAAKVQTTSDLHNTDWTYSVTYFEFLNNLGIDTTCMQGMDDETMTFGLNFDGTYAHFSFPDNVMAFGGDEGLLEQIYGVSYEYSYDGATHTGYLDGVADDENDNPGQLQFTYNDATDIITFNLAMFYPEDSTAVSLTLNFARNE